jgi:hypothetical protein
MLSRARLVGLLAVVLCSLTVSLALNASSAQAASSAQQAVPTCVTTQTWTATFNTYVRVTNTCSYVVRFRINWEYDFDSECITLYPTYSVVDSRPRTALFAGLYDC